MSTHFAGWSERTIDLASERFTSGLDATDQAALENSSAEEDLAEFESVIAAIHLSQLANLDSPSNQLINSLERTGRECVAARNESTPADEKRVARLRALSWSGWIAAAAVLVAFAGFRTRDAEGLVEKRQALIADAGDLVRLDWSRTEDASAKGATGDVVWSSKLQEGYMRFEGLAANDPNTAQYQLWIFDPTRADWEAKPVDGGVFDVSENSEVVVAISPKLEIRETALFAVTVEEPGGVVVSERERLVLTAAL